MNEHESLLGAPAAGLTNGHGNHMGDLALALSKAQAAFPKLVKDQTAKIEGTKSSYTYKYSDLASLFEAIRKPLSDNGLALVQLIDISPSGSHYILTQLLHVSGAKLESRMLLADHDRPQELGSEITYKRRYALSAMVGIASEVDDDGAAAQIAPVRAVPGYYRAKAPVHGPEAIHAGTPPTQPPMGDVALKDISEELMPNTDAAADDRAFLEKGVKRWADKHDLSSNERMALQASMLKGKAINKAEAADLNKLYVFLNDPMAVKGWREEVARKVNAAPAGSGAK